MTARYTFSKVKLTAYETFWTLGATIATDAEVTVTPGAVEVGLDVIKLAIIPLRAVGLLNVTLVR